MKKWAKALVCVLAVLIALMPVCSAGTTLDMSGLDALLGKKQSGSVEGGKAAQLAQMTGGAQEIKVGYVLEGLAHAIQTEEKVIGFDLEVAEEILLKANYRNYSFVQVSEEEALALLDQGEITLLMGDWMEESKLSRVVEVSSGNELKLAEETNNRDSDEAAGENAVENETAEQEVFEAENKADYFRTAAYLNKKGEVTLLDGSKADLGNKEYYLIGGKDSAKIISAFDRAYEKVYVNGFIDEKWENTFETTWLYRVWRSIRKAGFSVWRQFRMNLIDENRYQMIFLGLGRTVLIAVSSAVLGVILGCVIALMRLSNAKIGKWKFLQSISSIYVDVIRGTPVVVQLMIMYYVILTSPDISKITVAIITFGLNSAAYVSEMVRGGILAVDKGQTEAGRSLGLSAGATMMLIVLPQTIKIIIPSLFNEIIMLLKETSVVGFIGLMDLTKAGDFIRSRTYSAFFPLLTVAAVYLIIVSALTRVFNRVERRLRQGDIR